MAILWSKFTVNNTEEEYWQYIDALLNWENQSETVIISINKFIQAVNSIANDMQFDLSNIILQNIIVAKKEYSFAWNFSKKELLQFFTEVIQFKGNGQINFEEKIIYINSIGKCWLIVFKEDIFNIYNTDFHNIIKTKIIEELVDIICNGCTFKFANHDMCPLEINIYALSRKDADPTSIKACYPSKEKLYKEFIKSRGQQLQIANCRCVDEQMLKAFDVWLQYIIAHLTSENYKVLSRINWETPYIDDKKIYNLFEKRTSRDKYVVELIEPRLVFGSFEDAGVFAKAIRDNDTEKIIVYKSIVNDIAKNHQATPLMQASFLNKPQIVKMLLDVGANINLQNYKGLTALDFAILGNNLEICKILLQNGAKINIKSHLFPRLIMASTFGQIEICRLLLENGNNVNEAHIIEQNPLKMAIFTQNLELAKLLLEHHADPNYKFQDMTLLFYTLEDKLIRRDVSFELFKLLLLYQADPNATDKIGNTILHYIIRWNLNWYIDELLKYNIDLNITNVYGNTPLHEAILAKNDYAFDVLKNNKDSKFNIVNKDGNTLLHLAVLRDYPIACEYLLSRGSLQDKKNLIHKTPLMLAIEQNSVKLTSLFFNKQNMPVNFAQVDLDQNSVLHLAVKSQDYRLATVLLKNNHPLNMQNIAGDTPLHIATNKSDVKITAILLLKGADPNIYNTMNLSPLLIVVNKQDALLKKVFFTCAQSTTLERHLTGSHATLPGPTKALDEHGELSPLLQAYYNNKLQLFEDLLIQGLDPNIKDQMHNSLLYLCLIKNHADYYKLLFKYKADPNQIMHDGYNLLNKAILLKDYRTCKILLENGADPMLADRNQTFPWKLALINNLQNIINLIAVYLKKRNFINSEGESILYEEIQMCVSFIEKNAAKHCIERICFLLLHGADPNYNSKSTHPLYIAAKYRNIKLCKLLLEYGANPNIVLMDDKPLLHYLIDEDQFEIVKLLFKYNADPNIPDKFDNFALYHAFDRRGCEYVKIVLENNGHFNQDKKYFMDFFSVCRDPEKFKLLLEYNAIKNSFQDIPGDKLLHYAAKNGHIEICRVYLQYNQDVNLINDNQDTALHSAAEYQKFGVCKLLLEHKAEVNLKNKKGQTPLHLATSVGNTKIVTLLLSKSAEVNTIDNNGMTPLHYAAYLGYIHLIELLINNGATIDVFDSNNCTPLMGSYIYGYIDVYQLLLSYNTNFVGCNLKEIIPAMEENYQYQKFGKYLLSKTNDLGGIIVEEPVFKHDPQQLYDMAFAEDPNNKNNINQLFVAAIRCGRADICNFFLVKNELPMREIDNSNEIFLRDAAKYDRVELLELFLQHGMTERYVTPSYTALYEAMKHNRVKPYEILLTPKLLDYMYAAISLNQYDENICEFLLKKGLDPNQIFYYDLTVLQYAVEQQAEEICNILLKYGADPNYSSKCAKLWISAIENNQAGILKLLAANNVKASIDDSCLNSPLSLAVKREQLEICEMLLINGANPNSCQYDDNYPLIEAIKKNNFKLCKLLLEYGADPNLNEISEKNPISFAVALNRYNIFKLLLKYVKTTNYNQEKLKRLLRVAIRCKNHKIAELLLAWIEPKNINDFKCYLILAIENDAPKICDLFLKHCSMVDPIKDDIPILHYAVLCKSYNVVAYLLKQGVDPNIKDLEGRSALHLAASEGLYIIGKALIKYKAHVDILDQNGHSSLILAIANGKLTFCYLLIEAKADPNLYGPNNLTPLKCACIYNLQEIALHLIKNNACLDYCMEFKNDFIHLIDLPGGDELYQNLFKHISMENRLKSTKKITKIHKNSIQKIVEILLNWEIEYSAAVDSSALHIAVLYGLIDVCKILIEMGASINQNSSLFGTPLYLAVKVERQEVVRLLLEHGADQDILSNSETTLEVAKYHNNTKIIKLLLKYNPKYKRKVFSSKPDSTSIDLSIFKPEDRMDVKGLISILQNMVDYIGKDKSKTGFTNKFNSKQAMVKQTLKSKNKIAAIQKDLAGIQTLVAGFVTSQAEEATESSVMQKDLNFKKEDIFPKLKTKVDQHFAAMLIKGTEMFMKQIDEVNKKYTANTKKIDDEVAEIESLKSTALQLHTELNAIPNDNLLEKNYKAEELMQHLEKMVIKANEMTKDNVNKISVDDLRNKFNQIRQGTNKNASLPINEIIDELTNGLCAVEKNTNIRFIHLKELENKNTIITVANHIFLLQLELINKTVNLAEEMKCFPNPTHKLYELKELGSREYYDFETGSFIKELDEFTQKYINKKMDAYNAKPNVINREFVNLATVVGVFHNNIDKLHAFCLFINDQILARFAEKIKAAQAKYPGIKALHRYKTLQSINNFYLADIPGSLKESLSKIIENEKSDQFINSLYGSNTNNIYDLNENLDYLSFCLEQLASEFEKLKNEKIITTTNYLWKHKKCSNMFLTSVFYIVTYHGIIEELVPIIESNHDFSGWQ